MKKGLLALVAAGAAAVIAPGVAAAAAGTTCQLSGQASFATPLTAMPSAGTISYTFSGRLTNCQSTDPAIKTGVIKPTESGGTLAAGASCGGSTGTGEAVVRWLDGSGAEVASSAFTYTTHGAGAAVVLKVDTVTGRFAGGTGGGLLAFSTDHPEACAGPGLTSAQIDGITGIGAQ